ncbi:MAG: hypothetical protein OXT06_26790, partial [Rhodospirillaceae bacterium]|nr:hypothetical protein [Rhodospirillaceae bacterium]
VTLFHSHRHIHIVKMLPPSLANCLGKTSESDRHYVTEFRNGLTRDAVELSVPCAKPHVMPFLNRDQRMHVDC